MMMILSWRPWWLRSTNIQGLLHRNYLCSDDVVFDDDNDDVFNDVNDERVFDDDNDDDIFDDSGW